MNWLQESLDKINNSLSEIEEEKAKAAKEAREERRTRAANATVTVGELSESKVWTISTKEIHACAKMKSKLQNYTPISAIQRQVLSYLEPTYCEELKYKQLGDSNLGHRLDRYVKASKYWEVRTTGLEKEDGQHIKWVFAQNDEMGAVICFYRNNYIVCSQSSHENIMKEIEGRELKK